MEETPPCWRNKPRRPRWGRGGCDSGRVGSVTCVRECVRVKHGGVRVGVHRARVCRARPLAIDGGALSWSVAGSPRPGHVRACRGRAQSGRDRMLRVDGDVGSCPGCVHGIKPPRVRCNRPWPEFVLKKIAARAAGVRAPEQHRVHPVLQFFSFLLLV
jgi:hypothetical protein